MIDQIVAAVTTEWKGYDLAPFFYTRLNDLDVIAYRQEVMQDLEEKTLMQVVRVFSQRIREMGEHLGRAKKLYDKYERARWFLGGVEIYSEAVKRFLQDLSELALTSRGMRALREYLTEYVESAAFRRLVMEAETLKSDLSAIRYSLLLRDSAITVRHYTDEIDYSFAVEETFEKFRLGPVKDHRVKFPNTGMNHVEAQVLDRVALLHPDTFQALETFRSEHAAYLDKKIAEFDRAVQFYVSYLIYVESLRSAGLSFCYPQLSDTCKEISCRETLDLCDFAHGLFDRKLPDAMFLNRGDFDLQLLRPRVLRSGEKERRDAAECGNDCAQQACGRATAPSSRNQAWRKRAEDESCTGGACRRSCQRSEVECLFRDIVREAETRGVELDVSHRPTPPRRRRAASTMRVISSG